MFRSSIHTLRVCALVEGVSFLVLLGVAMPLKYLGGIPSAVMVVGWIHGILFMVFCAMLAFVYFRHRWPMWRAAVVFVAALLPFGPFVIDRRMRALEPTDV